MSNGPWLTTCVSVFDDIVYSFFVQTEIRCQRDEAYRNAVQCGSWLMAQGSHEPLTIRSRLTNGFFDYILKVLCIRHYPRR